MKTATNEDVYQKICRVIPGGVNSPIRSCRAVGQTPMVAERGEGALVYDVEGRGYIDFCCSWGALIHGHAHPVIIREAAKRMSLGSSFGITTEIEGRLAEKIIAMVPSVEKVRFVSSGTEATMSAVRLARGFTGRDLVIKFDGNYHGHGDHFLVKAGSAVGGYIAEASSKGVPPEMVSSTLSLPFNDIEAALSAIEANGDRLAAVILEPIAGNMGLVPALPEFMEMLRDKTAKCGALLILDEVMTGFRVAKGGAQSLYGVKPDLTCFAKVMGGGFPAAAFGGRADIMDHLAPDGPVFQAGTLSGNPVAMEAGLQALEMLDAPGVYEELERKTKLITEPLRDYIEMHELNCAVQEACAMFTLFFGKRSVKNFDDAVSCDKERFGAFYRFMYSKGVYVPPLQLEAWFISTAHTDEQLIRTRDLAIEFLQT